MMMNTAEQTVIMEEHALKFRIRSFHFYYQDAHAIDGLNLDIYEKEITAVFGPAGSGVSTLLRSLNRLSDLTVGARAEGEILLDGQSIYGESYHVTDLRRKVGMVFEVPTPLPMSILDNVTYGPRLSGEKNKSALMELAEESLRLSALWDEVKDRLHMSALRLSGGQQQRLCIARVLALQPEVILLDRPCAALDPISTSMIEDSLLRLKEQYTIIIAPHNIAQVSRITDRSAFMLVGKLVEAGGTEELFANPKEQQTSDYITGRFG